MDLSLWGWRDPRGIRDGRVALQIQTVHLWGGHSWSSKGVGEFEGTDKNSLYRVRLMELAGEGVFWVLKDSLLWGSPPQTHIFRSTQAVQLYFINLSPGLCLPGLIQHTFSNRFAVSLIMKSEASPL